METDEIVPNIFPELPSRKITVILSDGKKIECGQELTPGAVKEQPSVTWDNDSSPEKYYTLLMIDPDAPSRKYPVLAEVNHWLIGNIEGCDLNTGDVIVEYRGSGPPKYTGLHRYILVVFEQESKLHFNETKISKSSVLQRTKFSAKKFMKKYNFDKVFAWNFFKAQWSSSSDEPCQETRAWDQPFITMNCSFSPIRGCTKTSRHTQMMDYC